MNKLRKWAASVKEAAHRVYQRINAWSGGIPDILRDTIRHFTAARGPEAAASLAYYSIFSLFPLLLALVVIGSFFLESDRILNQVLIFLRFVLPVSQDLVIDNIQQVLEQRGAIGVVGVVGLVWSASAAFTVLFVNINRAWTKAAPLSNIKSRLIAVLLILVLGVFLVLVLFSGVVLDLLPKIDIPLISGRRLFESTVWVLLSNLIPPSLTFFLFLFLFRWAPNTHVRWIEAFWGALVAATAWELTSQLFAWYLSSGIAGYEFIYGSLGTMIALLFWIYLNSLIVLFCAHLTAMIAHHKRIALQVEEVEINPAQV